MNEHDISYKNDRKRFHNPEGYGEPSAKYQYMSAVLDLRDA